ncbi:hypothetical protein BpHYR1_031843 [Brachionus plicatilis]|uniref:Uncharacterized protein n=1 Tax=Brachionus plicatilis TaxID=10195 RepID=A0A3M7Q563_BRAPC|nr:hypothetical protein BpHYR1_031843 [Brachionus plicatilis]
MYKKNTDQFLYRDILAEYLFPYVASNINENFKLHQDNNPKHKSYIYTTFLETNRINWIN